MRAFWAIFKLTVIDSSRSRVFLFLLALLLVCAFVLPLTVEGDGTALGHIQVSLRYSLSMIAFILTLSTIWIGCYAMTTDMDGRQSHMVFVKPAPRTVVWLGKCVGVIVPHLVLLALGAGAVYGLIFWRMSDKKFPEKELLRLRQEVLVGRRVYYQELPNIAKLAQERLQERLKNAARQGEVPDAAGKLTMYKAIFAEIIGGLGEIKPYGGREFQFNGVSADTDQPIFLRYRLFVGGYNTKERQQTMGMWAVKLPSAKKDAESDEQPIGPRVSNEAMGGYVPMSFYPETFLSNYFYELALSPEIVYSDGNVYLSFRNFDPNGRSVFFQPNESPTLMVKKSGFAGNYARGVGVLALLLVLVAVIACSVAGLVSMPIAVFFTISYFFFGVIISFLLPPDTDIFNPKDAYIDPAFEAQVGRTVSYFLRVFVIPPQKFEVSEALSSGQLIEPSYCWELVRAYALLRALPIALLAIYLYSRREIGMVDQK